MDTVKDIYTPSPRVTQPVTRLNTMKKKRRFTMIPSEIRRVRSTQEKGEMETDFSGSRMTAQESFARIEHEVGLTRLFYFFST